MVRLSGRITYDLMLGWCLDSLVGSPTGEMVAGVAIARRRPSKHQEMDSIAMITQAGLTALGAGNLEAVGMAMDACHEKLQNIGVSSPELRCLS